MLSRERQCTCAVVTTFTNVVNNFITFIVINYWGGGYFARSPVELFQVVYISFEQLYNITTLLNYLHEVVNISNMDLFVVMTR